MLIHTHGGNYTSPYIDSQSAVAPHAAPDALGIRVPLDQFDDTREPGSFDELFPEPDLFGYGNRQVWGTRETPPVGPAVLESAGLYGSAFDAGFSSKGRTALIPEATSFGVLGLSVGGIFVRRRKKA